MRKLDNRLGEPRVELVTAAFVASGRPDGAHDFGRLLENLNNPTLFGCIELHQPSVRPLYSGGDPLALDVPLLVRREDVIFAAFEGPYFTRGLVRPQQVDVPVLLLTPPFQVQGTVAMPPGVDRTQALRNLVRGFFAVRDAQVLDSDGAPLREGEQIAVNGALVEMYGATERHIRAAAGAVTRVPRAVAPEAAAPAANGTAATRAA
jgi:hypothetical protein